MIEAGTVSRAGGSVAGDALRAALAECRWPVLYLLCLTAVVAGWCRAVELTITGGVEVALLVIAVSGGGIVVHLAGTVTASLPGRPASLYVMVARFGRGFMLVGIWAGIGVVSSVVSYASARSGRPLHDAAFIRLDAALGFDWRAWAAFVHARPLLTRAAALVYGTLALQTLLVFLVAALRDDGRRLTVLMWTFSLAALVTCVVSGLVPAVGAMPWFGLPGADWIGDLATLRSPGPVRFALAAMHGIVTLPSFHTVLAVLFAWGFRGGAFGVAAALFNLAMIASTITQGGHYLVDLIAGAALAVATIALVEWRVRQAARAAPR